MTTPPARDVTSDRPALSRARIIEAAVALVDKEGFEGLSMRRLGAALGVEAMSIYNYVANKAELLDGITEQVISEIAIPEDGRDWRDRIKDMARSYRELGRAHPNIAPLIAMRPFTDLPALRPIEVAFEILEDAGFRGRDALHAVRTLAAFATGFVLAETGRLSTERDTVRLDTSEISTKDFPRLAGMAPHIADLDEDQQFEFGLDVLLDGLAARI